MALGAVLCSPPILAVIVLSPNQATEIAVVAGVILGSAPVFTLLILSQQNTVE